MFSLFVSMLPDAYLPVIFVGGGLALILGLVRARNLIGFLGVLLLFNMLSPFIDSFVDALPLWVILIISVMFIFFALRTVLSLLLGKNGAETFVGHLFYDILRCIFGLIGGAFRLIMSLLFTTVRVVGRNRVGGNQQNNLTRTQQPESRQARRRNIFWIIAVLLMTSLVISYGQVEAKSAAGTLERAAAKKIIKKINIAPRHFKRFGTLHFFKHDTKLVRFTKRPYLDKNKGLGPHSFWIRSKRGRNPSAAYAKNKLVIPHNVKAKEMTLAKKGWLYHERPVRNGKRHIRETILEKRVSGKGIMIQNSLSK